MKKKHRAESIVLPEIPEGYEPPDASLPVALVAGADTWTFASSARRPDGLEITVSIDVDPDAYGGDFPEVAEIAQMAVNRAVADLRTNERMRERMDQPIYVPVIP